MQILLGFVVSDNQEISSKKIYGRKWLIHQTTARVSLSRIESLLSAGVRRRLVHEISTSCYLFVVRVLRLLLIFDASVSKIIDKLKSGN